MQSIEKNEERVAEHAHESMVFVWKLRVVILALSVLVGAVLLFYFKPYLEEQGLAFHEFHTYLFTFGYFILVGFAFFVGPAMALKNQRIRALHQQIRVQRARMDALHTEISGLKEAVHVEKQNHNAVIHAIDHIWFEVDKQCRMVFVNNAWKELTGFELDVTENHDFQQYIHPDDREKFKGLFEELNVGKRQKASMYTQIRKENGTFMAAELSVARVVLDTDGSARIVGTIHDVEQRRRAERALGEAEKKYRSIVENAAGGIYQLTPEGLYLSANPSMARILGYSTPEMLLREVKNAHEMVYVNSAQQAHFIAKCEKTDEVVHQETKIKTADGREIWVSENSRAVRDEHGMLLFIEGSLEDIDERKKAEIVIRDAKVQSDMANRAKSEFIANMSHELRTPLNSIIGFSEMISQEVFGPLPDPKYKDYAQDIFQSGQGLLAVINEILDISKIDVGERQLNDEVLDMQATIEDCLHLLKHKIEANKMVVTMVLDDVPQVRAEGLALKQVFMNLLSNALKFTPQGGRVTISHQVDGDGRLCLSVTDTGIGLSEEEIHKALSPFGQLNNELNREGSGTGLGLTLVNALVKLHGGEFELFSQKGIGTTATIILPKFRVIETQRRDTAEPVKS